MLASWRWAKVRPRKTTQLAERSTQGKMRRGETEKERDTSIGEG